MQTSILAHCTAPVAVTALILDQLPLKRRGLTEFTFSRYLVPFLMGYRGRALFLDPDMLARADLKELFALADDRCAVQVVKNERLRFEWPSLMLFNCEACAMLTPDFVERGNPQAMEWGKVGELPGEWNRAVGYEDCSDAKILHYTAGIPAFTETQVFGYVAEWKESLRASCSTVPWQDLLGDSVHAPLVKQVNKLTGKEPAPDVNAAVEGA